MNEYMAFGSNGNYSITFMKPSQLIFVTCSCLRFTIYNLHGKLKVPPLDHNGLVLPISSIT